MSSEVVVLFCKLSPIGGSDDVDVELIDGTIDYNGRYPKKIHRLELSGWTEYQHRSVWFPRKDGVFAEMIVYVNGEISDIEIINVIVNTLDAPED